MSTNHKDIGTFYLVACFLTADPDLPFTFKLLVYAMCLYSWANLAIVIKETFFTEIKEEKIPNIPSDEIIPEVGILLKGNPSEEIFKESIQNSGPIEKFCFWWFDLLEYLHINPGALMDLVILFIILGLVGLLVTTETFSKFWKSKNC